MSTAMMSVINPCMRRNEHSQGKQPLQRQPAFLCICGFCSIEVEKYYSYKILIALSYSHIIARSIYTRDDI